MKLFTTGPLALWRQSQRSALKQCLATSNHCADFTTVISQIFIKPLILEIEKNSRE